MKTGKTGNAGLLPQPAAARLFRLIRQYDNIM